MSDDVNLAMMDLTDVASLVEVAPDSTVSRTVLKAEGARLVLFSFDEGQELTEHTAAVPVLLQVLDGRLRVAAGGEQIDLVPGGVVHLAERAPHSVLALEPTRMLLTMLDPRVASA
jgi:quercetin dioxygenase-like cupin family protein